MDEGHEVDACEEIMHEEGDHEVHSEGEDAGEVHSSTPTTTIATPEPFFS